MSVTTSKTRVETIADFTERLSSKRNKNGCIEEFQARILSDGRRLLALLEEDTVSLKTSVQISAQVEKLLEQITAPDFMAGINCPRLSNPARALREMGDTKLRKGDDPRLKTLYKSCHEFAELLRFGASETRGYIRLRQPQSGAGDSSTPSARTIDIPLGTIE